MDGSNRRGGGRGGRLFGTTTGKILTLLCQRRRTVNEMAAHLRLTGNAVRAQLQRLQRDGLVRRSGSRRGVRRPHADYELTPDALRLFPRAYEPVLVRLVDALSRRLAPEEARLLLSTVAHEMLRDFVGSARATDPRKRLGAIVANFGVADSGIEIEKGGRGAWVLRPCSCPLASVTASRPELCTVVADSIAEYLGTTVIEQCERGDIPRCRFRIAT